jgi:hypothetical protein
LVGAYGQIAATTIERENPNVKAVIVEEGSMVTQEIDCDRVRVWVSKRDGTVIQVPGIG